MVGEVWVVNENRELLYSQLLSPNYNTAAQEALWRSCQVVLLFPRPKDEFRSNHRVILLAQQHRGRRSRILSFSWRKAAYDGRELVSP